MSAAARTSGPSKGASACAELRIAFDSALPWPDSLQLSHQHALVGLFALDEWKPWFPQAAALLDGPEQKRVQRRQRPMDREALTLAYALHRLFLQATLGMDAAAVPLARDALGCPRFNGVAAHTSLSHSEAHVAVAVCRQGPVGVDVEPRERRRMMHEIAGQVCHPEENAEMCALSEEARADALLALWVRKEALLKAAGIGLARPMNDFCAHVEQVLPLDSSEGTTTFLRMLDHSPDVVMAVAAPPEVPVLSAWFRTKGVVG